MERQWNHVCRTLFNIHVARRFGPAFQTQDRAGSLGVRDQLADGKIEWQANEFELAAAKY